MPGSFRSVVRGGLRSGSGFVFRVARRTVMESLYLLTAPVLGAASLLAVIGGLCLGTFGLALAGGPPVVAEALAPARWFADVERWRIAKVRSRVTWAPRPAKTPAASDPGVWLGVAHTVAVLPIMLITWPVTFLWWWVGLAATTVTIRNPYPSGTLRPLTLNAGNPGTGFFLSLGLTTPAQRIAFDTALGIVVLLTLPLVTRVCVAAQAGLGEALLSDTSALHRRIAGLERERDTARAQTVAAVSAEATALRRLERDIHDGPQQRLVRLTMELGRAQHHFDSRPAAAREALADAIVQTQEALDELRALSRGIAPPILVDRGLRAALTALAARCTIPARLDADPLDDRLDAAVETAAYFVIAEALTNAAKHSNADRCAIGLRHGGGALRVWVTDDGVGGAALAKGHGLRGLDDRVHAIGGRLKLRSPRGGPTTIMAELPCC